MHEPKDLDLKIHTCVPNWARTLDLDLTEPDNERSRPCDTINNLERPGIIRIETLPFYYRGCSVPIPLLLYSIQYIPSFSQGPYITTNYPRSRILRDTVAGTRGQAVLREETDLPLRTKESQTRFSWNEIDKGLRVGRGPTRHPE